MRLGKVLRLASRDYRHEGQMSSFYILALAAVLVSFVATLYPSRQAAGIDPVEVIRYESSVSFFIGTDFVHQYMLVVLILVSRYHRCCCSRAAISLI